MPEKQAAVWNGNTSTIVHCNLTHPQPTALISRAHIAIVRNEPTLIGHDHDRVDANICCAYGEDEPIMNAQIRALRHAEELIREKIRELEALGAK